MVVVPTCAGDLYAAARRQRVHIDLEAMIVDVLDQQTSTWEMQDVKQ
jgi:hypothetical protein